MENQEKKPFVFYGEKEVTIKQGKKETKVTRRLVFCGVETANNIINIGMSMCSEKDIFTKKKGKAIATGRAYKKPVTTLVLKTGEKAERPAVQFVNQIKKLIVQ